MTIDINRSFTGAWCIVPSRRGVVANHGYHNASISSLVHHILHVVWIRELFATASLRILVLWLVEDHRSTICDLCFGYGSINVGDIADQTVLVRQ